jgi:hypothetical protein
MLGKSTTFWLNSKFGQAVKVKYEDVPSPFEKFSKPETVFLSWVRARLQPDMGFKTVVLFTLLWRKFGTQLEENVYSEF